MRLWLDATDPYGNGTPVPSNITSLSTWTDKSTYKNNATGMAYSSVTTTHFPASITYQPTGFNSLYPTFSFSSSDKSRFQGEFPTSNLSNISGQNMRVFFVGTNGSGRVISFSDTYRAADYNSWNRWFFADNAATKRIMTPYRNGVNLRYGNDGPAASISSIWQGWFNGNSLNLKYFYSAADTSYNTTRDDFNTTSNYLNIKHYAIGSNTTGDDQWGWFTGLISEILVYNGTLTNTQVEQIEGYLAHKWGLVSTLPSNHAYKTSGPNSQIITEITKL